MHRRAEWHALTVGNSAAPPALTFSKIKNDLVDGRHCHSYMPNFWWFTKKLLVERSSHERLRSHLERRTVKAAASHRPGSARLSTQQ